MNSEFLTLSEFASLMHCADITVRKWRARGYGPPSIKIGGRIMFLSREVDAWLRAQPVGSDAIAQK
jgi:predicted DNA-binding transcriptional regulator AlpA